MSLRSLAETDTAEIETFIQPAMTNTTYSSVKMLKQR